MDDIINQIDGQVQIIFERTQDNQTYRDAIWMTQEEYDMTEQATIDTIKQERFDNWLAIVNATPIE
jgi:hypothetical protein